MIFRHSTLGFRIGVGDKWPKIIEHIISTASNAHVQRSDTHDDHIGVVPKWDNRTLPQWNRD